MRRRGTWTLVAVALALAAAGALAPMAGAKPPTPTPPSTAAPATTKAPKASKAIPATTRVTATTAAPTTTTTPPAPPPSVPVAAAPAPEPTFSVTPRLDLEHLQTVEVSGSGYGAGENIQLAQCRADAAFEFQFCDGGSFQFLFADDSGSWTTSVQVRARLGSSPPFDCVDEFGACVIAVGHGQQQFILDGAVPIGFAPDAIPPPPEATVSPRTGLAHGQQITVSGTGVAAGAIVLMGECLAGSTQSPICAQQGGAIVGADDTGAFQATFTVARLFSSPVGPAIDCLVDKCVIQVAAIDGLYNIVERSITFDPDAPIPPRPTLTVEPDDDLAHDQVVRVSGRGFVPNFSVFLFECSREGDPYPQCAFGPSVEAVPDANGNFETTVTVKRVLGYPGQAVDCLDVACVIHSGVFGGDVFTTADASISFDPDAPLPPPPVLTAIPNRDLTHNQVITVEGRGFTPNTFVNLYECVEDEDETYGQCAYSFDQTRVTDSTGAFTTTFVVKRIIGYFGGTTTDCLEQTACVLLAQVGQDPISGAADLELHLDPDAPLPPPPRLTVEPATDLGARQAVEVHGHGFAPNAQHNLVQCAEDGDQFSDIPCSFGPTITADEQGEIDTTFLARRFLPGFVPAGTVDCAVTQECVLSLFSYDDALSHATASVRFDPDAPLPPPPAITVTPSTGLVDGAVVTVSGTGFVPNALVSVSQCDGIDPSGLSCAPAIGKFVAAGDDGTFTTDYVVHPGIFVQRGIVGCYDAPGACTIQSATFGEIDGVSNAVPLAFGGSVTPSGDGGGTDGGDGTGGGTTPTPVRTGPAPRFAFTGTPVDDYLEFAAVFLGLGTLLVLASRRRRYWGRAGA